jgi:hypothetical protein
MKRLDRFLVSEKFLEKGLRFLSKVEEGGSSYHLPISLRWSTNFLTPPPPPPPLALKNQQSVVRRPRFSKIVTSNWKKLKADSNEPLMIQFEKNLKNTKATIKKWIPKWKAKKSKEIFEIENELSRLGTRLDRESLSLTLLEELRCLEKKCNEWLKHEEEEWRLKIRALWLKFGDNNTKFFHNFSNQRQNLNTIWELKNEEGIWVSSFLEKAETGARYFESLFSAPEGCPIQEILQVVAKFHPLFSEEMNQLLLKEVSLEEVRAPSSQCRVEKVRDRTGF